MRRYIFTKRNFWTLLIALVFSATLFGCTVVHYNGPARVRFQGPPHLYHIPGSYVYVVADMDVGIFFYDGYWYRSYNNYWFRARYYNGSWLKVVIGSVPPRLHSLPRTYRSHIRRDAYRIPYRDLKQHYKRWERERYWDKGRGREIKNKNRPIKIRQEHRKDKRRHGSDKRERFEDRREDKRERVHDRRNDRRERIEENRENVDKRRGLVNGKGKPVLQREPTSPKKVGIKGKKKNSGKKVKGKKKDKKKGKKKKGAEDDEH